MALVHLLEPTLFTAYEMLSDGAGDRVRHWTGIEEMAIAWIPSTP